MFFGPGLDWLLRSSASGWPFHHHLYRPLQDAESRRPILGCSRALFAAACADAGENVKLCHHIVSGRGGDTGGVGVGWFGLVWGLSRSLLRWLVLKVSLIQLSKQSGVTGLLATQPACESPATPRNTGPGIFVELCQNVFVFFSKLVCSSTLQQVSSGGFWRLKSRRW